MRALLHPTWKLALAAATVALVVIGAPASSVTADPPPRAQSSATTVTVGDNFFRAKSVSIRAGGSVKWRWAGSNRHNVIFTSGRRPPKACPLQRSGSCTRKFSRRGTYGYLCTVHAPGMKGRVTVR